MGNKGFNIFTLIIIVTLVLCSVIFFPLIKNSDRTIVQEQPTAEITIKNSSSKTTNISETNNIIDNKNGIYFEYPSNMSVSTWSTLEQNVTTTEGIKVKNIDSTFLVYILDPVKGNNYVQQNKNCDNHYDGGKKFEGLDTFAQMMFVHASECDTNSTVIKDLSQTKFKDLNAFEFTINDEEINTYDGGFTARNGPKTYIMTETGGKYLLVIYDIDTAFDTILETLEIKAPLRNSR